MDINEAIYNDSRCPTWSHGILISSEYGVEIEMGEGDVEKIHPSAFEQNWRELFKEIKNEIEKKKAEKDRIAEENELKIKALKQTEEYKTYLLLKEKYKNV